MQNGENARLKADFSINAGTQIMLAPSLLKVPTRSDSQAL